MQATDHEAEGVGLHERWRVHCGQEEPRMNPPSATGPGAKSALFIQEPTAASRGTCALIVRYQQQYVAAALSVLVHLLGDHGRRAGCQRNRKLGTKACRAALRTRPRGRVLLVVIGLPIQGMASLVQTSASTCSGGRGRRALIGEHLIEPKRALNVSIDGRIRPGRMASSTAVPGGSLTRKGSQVSTLSRPPARR